MSTHINVIGVQNLSGQSGTQSFAGTTSPTFVTPALGVPTSGTLTSCTGLPLTTGVTGILPIANGGTGVSSGSVNTIAADTSSATPTGGTLTFDANTNAGNTVNFVGSSHTVFLKTSDSNHNTCIGDGAGGGFGINNTALGYQAGINASGADRTTMIGFQSGGTSSGDYNTCLGYSSGSNLAGTETANIYIQSAGVLNESHTIRIGNATGTGTNQNNVCAICGINGKTSSSGIAVLINSSDVLGTTTSSIRYKENVKDIKDPTDVLMSLRPVSFNYKREHLNHIDQANVKDLPLEYGLIAEEAESVIPELIIYDDEGLPQTIRYLHLDFLMLKEIQKLRTEINELKELAKTAV